MTKTDTTPNRPGAPAPLMTTQELAELLVLPIATLHTWRSRGLGPPGFRVGRHVRYRREAVESWIRDQEAKAS